MLQDPASGVPVAFVQGGLGNATSVPGVIDLGRNHPAQSIELLATSNAVLVRKNLHPDLVQEFVRILQQEHSGPGLLHKAGQFPTAIDPEYPMSEAAQRYYRQGPSLLQRLLSYWLTTHAERLLTLLAAVAALFPFFSYGPRIYRWYLKERMRSLYKRLRAVESRLPSQPAEAERQDMAAELDSLIHAARELKVPVRHSDLFFELQGDIQLVRRRLRELDAPAG